MRTTDQVLHTAPRAEAILKSHLVWDNHACMPLRPGDHRFLPRLAEVLERGVDVISLNVGYGGDSLESHVRMIADFRHWLGRHPDRFVLLRSVEDIDAARASGRLAVTFDIEGMSPLDQGDHGLVEMFRDLGVSWMLIAYNRNNAAGGGCHDEDGGLTHHGREILREMKRVGMVVCCSHTGHRTVREVMDAADNPVIFSHSNPLALADHARNIPDDLIKACAATGGVVGVNGIGFFLGTNINQPEAIARAIDHVVQLVGPDHAGIGLDYMFDSQEIAEVLVNRPATFPAGYDGPLVYAGPEALTGVVSGLLRRGYGEGDIAKILGGNWRRVAATVWGGSKACGAIFEPGEQSD